MLRHLHIQNYALIDELDIDLKEGFSVITGETGSGKSILLGALGLVLGKRADTTVLFDKQRKCIIEAEFEVKGLEKMFSRLDLDFDDCSVFRREIAVSGRSRAFINDTPVQLSDLKALSAQLVDVHSQHETLLLQGSDIQLQLVDSFSAKKAARTSYDGAYQAFKKSERERDAQRALIAEERIDKDYLNFQIDELTSADLVNVDQEKMAAELRLMENAGEIKSVLTAAHDELSEAERNIIGMLREIESQLSSIAENSDELKDVAERMKSSRIELDDVAATMLEIDGRLELDPERMSQLHDRSDEIHRLLDKHRSVDVEELIELEKGLSDKLLQADMAAEKLKELESQVEEDLKRLKGAAEELSRERRTTIGKLEERIASHLPELAMKNARLKVELCDAADYGIRGKDDIDFLFQANKGGEFQALRKTASGGELSRVMLILKSVLASKAGLPTLIFDEIDTGVSGEIAGRMAEMLKGIADGRQVIAISHLAQVASKAENHYRISKVDTAERTLTTVSALSEEERVTEIAQMLSGATPSKASIANAMELLNT